MRYLLIILCFLSLSAFTETQTITGTYSTSTVLRSQPGDERKAQDKLPKSHDALWDVLGKTKITSDDKKGVYKASFPDEVKKLDGTTMKVNGFMLPLEPTEKFKHFLLTRRTPTCPFCPPGQPNEIVEVFTDMPVAWAEELATFEGQFKLIDNGEKGLFFQLDQAKQK